MAKRTKKYRPKPVRTPTLMFKLMPPLTEEDLRELELMPLVALSAIEAGEATGESVDIVQSALCKAFIMACAFEQKSEIQLAALLGYAGMNAAGRRITRGEKQLPKSITAPARLALQALADMLHSLTREEVIRAYRAEEQAGHSAIRIARGACFHILPTEGDVRDLSPEVRRLCNRRGAMMLNGKVRGGYMRANEALDRLEWYAPVDDVTIAITEPAVLLLTEPLKEKFARLYDAD